MKSKHQQVRKSNLLLACLPLCLASAAALYMPVAQAMDDATTPPPGLYHLAYLLNYRVSDFRLPGTEQRLSGDNRATVTTVINRVIWISDWKVLGADYGVDFIAPVTRTSLKFNSFGLQESSTGVGDVYLGPLILGWHTPRWDVSVGAGWWLDNGRSGGLADPGRGYKTASINGGATYYLDEGRTASASAMLHLERNGKNDVGFRFGNNLKIDWGVGKRWGLLQASVVGYSQWQLTDDSGPAALTGAHSAHHAAGVQVSYIFWPQKAMLRAAFFREFNVRAGSGLATRGNLLRLTWIKAF